MNTVTVALTIPSSPQATVYDWITAINQNIHAAQVRGDAITAATLGNLLHMLTMPRASAWPS